MDGTAYMHAHTRTHTRAHTHTHTRTHARARTHAPGAPVSSPYPSRLFVLWLYFTDPTHAHTVECHFFHSFRISCVYVHAMVPSW